MIVWPGIEGYNYPFQTAYAESWARFVDGVGEAAQHARDRGVTLFLEHKNSEPAMKIFMRNVGMTLHVIHKLRGQGLDNVKVNMDWQHLIMNGENLAEYAGLLAAEGLLGHQHANSGWGTFDDDNMVGATAFMETLELALELRRRRLRLERRAARLRPVSVHGGRCRGGEAVGPAVAVHRRRGESDRRGRAARGPAGEGRRPRLRARLRRPGGLSDPLIGLDIGTTGAKAVAISPDGELLATAEEAYPLATPQAGWAEQDPEDWWRAAQACLARLPDGPVGLSGQMHGLVCLGGDGEVLRPAILWNDQRTAAECAEIERRLGLDRLIELTGNRALTGFTAPKLLWLRANEPDVYARIQHILLPKDYVRFRLTGVRAIDAADASGTLLFDVGRRRWSEEMLTALELPAGWLPTAHEATEIAGAGDQAAAALGVGIIDTGPVSVVLGTSGVVFAVLPAYAPDAEARVHVFCHAVPERWHAMGVMLSAAGSLAWVRRTLDADFAAARRRSGPLGAGQRGPPVRAVPRRRANAARRSERAGSIHRPVAPARPRRALARDAGGRRLRPARLARAPSPARRSRRGRPRLGRRRAQRAVAAHRRLDPRDPGRAHGVRGGIGARRRAARGGPGGRLRRRRRGGARAACAHATGSSRTTPGRRCTTGATRATGSSTPSCGLWRSSEHEP